VTIADSLLLVLHDWKPYTVSLNFFARAEEIGRRGNFPNNESNAKDDVNPGPKSK